MNLEHFFELKKKNVLFISLLAFRQGENIPDGSAESTWC